MESSWREISRLSPQSTVLVMVVGPTEQHGPHLPLGTDFYVAEEMARRMIVLLEEEIGWTVVEAPPLYYVPAVLSRGYPGSVSVRKQHYASYVADVMESFAANGLQNGILISTHIDPPFVTATQDMLKRINEEFGSRFIHGYERFPMEDVMSRRAPQIFGYERPGDVHAGILETSSLSVARPYLVNWDVAKGLEDQPIEFDDLARTGSFLEVGSGDGYTGYPRLADRKYGELWYSRYGEKFASVIRAYCRGEDVWDRLSISHLLS